MGFKKMAGFTASALVLSSLVAFGGVAYAGNNSSHHNTKGGADIHTKPPAKFVKVSDALKNKGMEVLPGLGTLYVDPTTLPAGPFLGYDKNGKLTNVTYMLPTAQLEKNMVWNNLGMSAKGLKIDHTDVHVSGAHPGVAERHVHVINWLIPHDVEVKQMGVYPHLHHASPAPKR